MRKPHKDASRPNSGREHYNMLHLQEHVMLNGLTVLTPLWPVLKDLWEERFYNCDHNSRERTVSDSGREWMRKFERENDATDRPDGTRKGEDRL